MSINKYLKILRQFSLTQGWILVKKVMIEFFLRRLYQYQQQIPYLLQANSNTYKQLLAQGHSFRKGKKYTQLVINNDPLLGSMQFRIRRTSTDLAVFQGIFLKGQYNEVVRLINAIKHPVHVVIDAGAYNGMSSIFFAQHFPKAHVWALDPSPTHFELLQYHLQINNVARITPVNKGLWSHSECLGLHKEGDRGEEWEISVSEIVNKGLTLEVEAVSLLDLMQTYQLRHIDLLKLNVEGAEKAIFEDVYFCTEILPKINFLIIQVHEDIIGKHTLARQIEQHQFSIVVQGRYIIAANNKLQTWVDS